jgi:methylmalonyl-CoA mutase C-terminal domain/subunit
VQRTLRVHATDGLFSEQAGDAFVYRPSSSRESIVMAERKIRVLVAKPGLDGHDRGAKVVAQALRDAGFEVIYTGIRQTPQMIAEAALQEDVDVVGLSILSGAHRTLCPKVVELLRTQGQGDVLVVVGGIIPAEDVPRLTAAGVAAVFGPGTTTGEIAAFIRENVVRREDLSEAMSGERLA